MTLDATPSISSTQAELMALNAIDPAGEILGDTQLRYVNLGLFGRPEKTTHLAWQMAVRTVLADYTVLIDAHTGASCSRTSAARTATTWISKMATTSG